MSDVFSSEKRSWIMRRVRGENTSPELKVRSLAHRLGYRFRLHRKDLPGKPDLVFPSRKKIILVHGCFWHGHKCSRGDRIPQANKKYWTCKIGRNMERDMKSKAALELLGWEVLIVWECDLKNLDKTACKIHDFLKR